MVLRSNAFHERREFARTDLSCGVKLCLPGGAREGKLLDLSRRGARLQIANAPAIGSLVLLQWAGHEAIGQIIWTRLDCCGVSFDRLLPAEAVEEALGLPAPRVGPAASIRNVQPGRRRRVAGTNPVDG